MAINMEAFLAAVKSRWISRGLADTITGGVTAGYPKERTKMPYAVIDTRTETPKVRTNKGKVENFHFTVNVFDLTPEKVMAHARNIQTALQSAPLSVGGGTVLTVDEGPVRYFEENYFHKAAVEFTAQVRQKMNFNPG